MNRYGLHPLACLRLLSAFVRSGLEYGMTVLEPGAPQLEKIRLCLKRGVCLFLGFSTNSRVDTLDAVTGLVPPAIRQQVLSMQRSVTLWSIWNSDNRDDFALAYVRYGIEGEAAIRSPPASYLTNPKAAATLSYYELFREPLNRRVSAATNGILPVASIRRLLHLKSPFKFIRVILMWLLRKWGSFLLIIV